VENPEALASKESIVKKSRFSEAQIVGILKEHEAGEATKEICRRHGISPATFIRGKPSLAVCRSVMSQRCVRSKTRIVG
jgi:putative transposase